MNQSILAVVVASLCSYSSFSFAQSNSADETVVVTANRFEQSLKEVLVPVSVVTRDDIELMQANSIVEVLQTLPGIQVSSNGGYGHLTTVYARGSKNILFLLNGVRIGSATSGDVNLGQLPLVGIERIEFIRGSRAAVYGADATAGVINIITTDQISEFGGKVSSQIGSDAYQQYQLAVGGALSEKSWARVSTNYAQADGFNVTRFGDPDKDGFESKDIVGEFGFQFSPSWQGIASVFYHKGYVDYDYNPAYGPSSDEADYELYNIAGQLAFANSSRSSNITIATNRDKSENFGTVKSSTIVTDRNIITWRHNEKLSDTFNFGFGAEYSRESVRDSKIVSSGATSQFDQTSRDNEAAYFTANYDNDTFQLEGAVRYDDNESYGDDTTIQTGIGWFMFEDLRLTMNYGTGYRVPTFNQLYWPGYANPELEPEESEDYEVAVEGYYSFADFRISVYRSDITNRISCQGSSSSCSNDNIRIEGVELTTSFDTAMLSHSLSLDLLDPKDFDSNKKVSHIARESFKWNVAYNSELWKLSLNYLYQGERYDGEEKLGSYSLVDVAGRYFITSNFNVGIRVSNLLNEEYQYDTDYNTKERSVYGSVEYLF